MIPERQPPRLVIVTRDRLVSELMTTAPRIGRVRAEEFIDYLITQEWVSAQAYEDTRTV